MKDQKAVYYSEIVEIFYSSMTDLINEELTNGWNVKGITSPMKWIDIRGLSRCSCLIVFERDLDYGE
jgi:hypothetical protein